MTKIIELSPEVYLPLPDKASGMTRTQSKMVKELRWAEVYKICLEEIIELDGEFVHKLVPMLGNILERRLEYVNDGAAISNRFIGEMCSHGELIIRKDWKFQKGREQERLITLPAKLKKLASGKMNTVVMPNRAGTKISVNVDIRRGITTKDNQGIVRDCSSYTSKWNYRINQFTYQLVHKDGMNLLPDIVMHDDDTLVDIKEKMQVQRIRDRALNSCEVLGVTSFWFPHFYDSRGRLYPATTAGISNQGADLEKSLIEPTYQEVLTYKGYKALIETLEGYSEQKWSPNKMVSHGNNPEKHYSEWMQADKPMNYIANAKYLARYHDNPETPLQAFIPLDGRASALQHWSALLRSTAVTKYIGMEEEEPDRDMYEYYRDLVQPKMPDEWKWLMEGAVGRKSAKKPVMVFAYGGKVSSTKDYLSKSFKDRGLHGSDLNLVSNILYDGLKDLLVDIIGGFEWITKVARIIGKGRDVIQWKTPDGFIACQTKVKPEEARKQTPLQNGTTFSTEYKDFSTVYPSASGHSTALSPNIIHSLDACHLRMVCRKMEEKGLPVIFIHDSFATHVNYRDELYEAITETFAEMYSGNILMDLYYYWSYHYKIELPLPPEQGNFDPKTVRERDLFFT